MNCAGTYMEVLYHFLHDMLLVIMALTYLVQAQEGFVTLDCGLSAGSSYVDELGIEYVSDAAFIDSGEITSMSPASNNSDTKRWLQTLRSFPEGTRNCYNIKVKSGIQYLVRATFHHGHTTWNNYAVFDLYIGYRKWVTVEAFGISIISKEIILATTTNYLSVCLVKLGSEMPFISLLELRPMMIGAYYDITGSLSLGKLARYNFGSATGEVVRYPDDAYDRLWEPIADAGWKNLSTTKDIDSHYFFPFQVPSEVMRTASSPETGDKLKFSVLCDRGIQLVTFLYFAELEDLEANGQSRCVSISSSQSPLESTPMILAYLQTGIMTYPETSYRTQYNLSVNRYVLPCLPPILNTVEVYTLIDMSQNYSDQGEVDAMMNIKLVYGIKRNWQGDPCLPLEYAWEGVGCNYSTSDGVPKIIALNLSFSTLVGAIASDIFNLTQLETLDLSHNGLNGAVPEFLAKMPSLNSLNVACNNLSGSIPPPLIEKSKRELLHLSYEPAPNGSMLPAIFEGNRDLCAPTSCNNNNKIRKRKRLFFFLVLVTVAVIITTAAMILFRFAIIRRRATMKNPALQASTIPAKSPVSRSWKEGRFTYAQLLAITNNFKEVLGHGGSGTVYHGYLHDNPVAVKILSSSSTQSYRQFQAEVDILLRVHHGNLLSLIGYCDECNTVGLIYEFIANGNLQEYMSGDDSGTLSWEVRLKISLGAAQGLKYLHHGCEPQIVHRDVKTSNILLSESLQAKLADFGLSRSFPVTGGSYLFTDVAGTFGYFDPEYFKSNRFTTKSDVYSFGVVLLEIVTGKPAVSEAEGMTHLSQLVTSILAEGLVTDVVDPKLGVEFDIDSITKFIELAMTCVSENSSQRPTMHQVVNELSNCLAIELARRDHKLEAQSHTVNSV